ncbi:hypothetical protein V2G26_009065 [Clonostachys chloroleuca]
MDTPSLDGTTSLRRILPQRPASHISVNSGSGYQPAYSDGSYNSRRNSSSSRGPSSVPHAHVVHSQDSRAAAPTSSRHLHHQQPQPHGQFGSPQPGRFLDLDTHPFAHNSPTDDLIGAPFDGAAILNRLDGPDFFSSQTPQPINSSTRITSTQRRRGITFPPHPTAPVPKSSDRSDRPSASATWMR